jgi:hypothetical protein
MRRRVRDSAYGRYCCGVRSPSDLAARLVSRSSFSSKRRMISAVSFNSCLGSCSTDALAAEFPSTVPFISISSSSKNQVARDLPFLIFLHLAPEGGQRNGTFRRRREKICATRNAVLLALSFLSRYAWQTAFRRRESNSGMTLFCTIEYGAGNTERRCGRVVVAECGHCAASVCSSCAKECCGQVLCGYCYDFHVIHSCVKRFSPTKLRPVPIAFRPAPHHYAV